MGQLHKDPNYKHYHHFKKRPVSSNRKNWHFYLAYLTEPVDVPNLLDVQHYREPRSHLHFPHLFELFKGATNLTTLAASNSSQFISMKHYVARTQQPENSRTVSLMIFAYMTWDQMLLVFCCQFWSMYQPQMAINFAQAAAVPPWLS